MTAFVSAVEKNLSNIGLNIVDDEPVTYENLYHFIAKQECVNDLTQSSIEAPFAFRIRNKFAKEKLNWNPFFKNYQIGLSK